MNLHTNKSDYIEAVAFQEDSPRLIADDGFPKNDFSDRALEAMKRSYTKSFPKHKIIYIGKLSSPEFYDLYQFIVDTNCLDERNQVIFDIISFQYDAKNEKFVAFQGKHYKKSDDIEFIWKGAEINLYDAIGTYINSEVYPYLTFIESLLEPEFIERYKYFKIINY